MKIMLLGMTKLKYMPYMDFYLNQIDPFVHEVHILYWDRDGKEDVKLNDAIKLHCFRADMEDGGSLLKKLPIFLKYRRFALQLLRKIKPDKLIVHYQNTGVLVLEQLFGKYSGKYILDYRDVTYERNAYFKRLVAKLVEHSYATFISSNGFRPYLPESDKIYASHNLIKSSIAKRESIIRDRIPSEKIRIAFWGMIRHVEVNCEIIRKLGGDSRFELHYYGRVQGATKQMLLESSEKIDNVFYHGEYVAEDRYEFAKHTDILHNIYSDSDKTAPIAMGNKLYDGPLFGLPELCMKGHYMAKLVADYEIGLACDPFDASFADDIYNYYTTLNMQAFFDSSKLFLNDVLKDIKQGEKIISEFINSRR